MARARKRVAPAKRHFTERYRGANLTVERWTNAKSAHIGFHLGQMKSYPDIARILADGTSPETLRSRAYKWRLPVRGRKSGILISLSSHKAALLRKQCEKLGIEAEEFLRRIAECVIGDDLYHAVTDGRFD